MLTIGVMPPIDEVPESEQGDLDDHSTPAELLELHEALEAIDAGFPPGAPS